MIQLTAANNNKQISVLLIEDLVGDAKAITRALSYGDIEQDYNILRAVRLQEGIKLLNDNKIDVILLDLSLPDAKDIKAVVELNNLFPNIPIIVLSDQSDDRVITRAINNGASKYLPKSEASGILIRKIIDQVILEHRLKLETVD
jgi:DNA-binding NarL/FixJ family response regulator